MVPRLVGLPLVVAKYVIAGASCRLGKVKRVAKGKNRREGWEDVQWALFNTKELLFNH